MPGFVFLFMSEKLIRLRSIFRDVIGDASLEISENTKRSDLVDWDSVAMVQIILAVENEFGVRFSTGEIADIKSVSDLMKKIP